MVSVVTNSATLLGRAWIVKAGTSGCDNVTRARSERRALGNARGARERDGERQSRAVQDCQRKAGERTFLWCVGHVARARLTQTALRCWDWPGLIGGHQGIGMRPLAACPGPRVMCAYASVVCRPPVRCKHPRACQHTCALKRDTCHACTRMSLATCRHPPQPCPPPG